MCELWNTEQPLTVQSQGLELAAQQPWLLLQHYTLTSMSRFILSKALESGAKA